MRLIDKIEKNEVTVNTQSIMMKKKAAVMKITSHDGAKDKAISAKVNSNMYALFTAINREIGLSNNSALNMIISEYVREKKYLLDENDI